MQAIQSESRFRPSALALASVDWVRGEKDSAAARSSTKRVFIHDSLMHPAELGVFRRCYGAQFFAVALFTDEDERAMAVQDYLEEHW